MDIASFGGQLCRAGNFHVSCPLLNNVAGRVFDAVVTFVRGQQARARANLDFLQTGRLLYFARWMMFGSGVHDIDPNWQGDFTAERTAINLLRLIEAGPNSAREIAVVTGKKRVGEIVSRAGLARDARNFLQTKLCARDFARSAFERIDKTRVH